MRVFLKALRKSESDIDKWDERIWMLMVESATVHRDGRLSFKFYNGKELKI